MFEHLGIVIDAGGNPINHRSVLKVCINPMLRVLGLCIATESNGTSIGKPVLIRYRPRAKHVKWTAYELPDDCKVIKRRIII